MPNAKDISLDRMVSAVENVRRRLLRVCGALERAGIPYAVAGGNAVAAWVSTVDDGAVRNTRDVDVMIERVDFPAVRTALEHEGLHYVDGLDVFLESPNGSVRDAVHLVFAGEQVRTGEPAPNPGLHVGLDSGGFKVLDLQSLVEIKLTAYRLKDRVHLQDMIQVGLIDEGWLGRLPPVLAERLKTALDEPE